MKGLNFVSVMGVLSVLVSAIGCAERTVIHAPLASPYPAEKVWAIAPLSNESGTSAVDPLYMSDLVAREFQQVRHIDMLPLSRVLQGMRAMQINQVQSVSEAQALIRLLNIDGLIVGTITAYDPYHPPVLGLTLQLFTSGNESARRSGSDAPINSGKGVRILGASPSDSALPGLRVFSQPVSSVSAIVDSSDNAVMLDVKQFAEGRTDPDTALGWEKYLYSMDAYTLYVSHRLIRDLLNEERSRMGSMVASFGMNDRFRSGVPNTDKSPPG